MAPCCSSTQVLQLRDSKVSTNDAEPSVETDATGHSKNTKPGQSSTGSEN